MRGGEKKEEALAGQGEKGREKAKRIVKSMGGGKEKGKRTEYRRK